MLRRMLLFAACTALAASTFAASQASAQQAFGRAWGGGMTNRDWQRMYHYPYVYYPQNYWNKDYFKSSQSLYNRYPAEMRIPVYNKRWQNYYPENRRYHSGHHFVLDVF